MEREGKVRGRRVCADFEQTPELTNDSGFGNVLLPEQ